MTILGMFQRVESTQQFLCYDYDIQEVGRYLKNLKTFDRPTILNDLDKHVEWSSVHGDTESRVSVQLVQSL